MNAEEEFNYAKSIINEPKSKVKALYHLYKSLKILPLDDIEKTNKNIKMINNLRHHILEELKLKELCYLVDLYWDENNYQADEVNFDLLYSVKKSEFMDKYRRLLLFNMESGHVNSHLYDYLDYLKNENLENEYVFWIDYLLNFENVLIKETAVFYKVLLLFDNKKYLEVIQFIDNQKSDNNAFIFDHLLEIKLYCLTLLKKFDEALSEIEKTNRISEFNKYLEKIKVLEAKQICFGNCEADLKNEYIFGISNYIDKIHILASSPYMAKRLKLNKKNVYHYTDVNGLLGILSNQEFRATKSDFLNDYKEQILILEQLQNMDDFIKKPIIRFFDITINNKIPNSFNNEMDNFIDNVLIKNYFKEVYVMSNSKVPDNLTLWGNYSKFEGYNIEFDKNIIVDDFKHPSMKNIYNYVIEGEVLYMSPKEIQKFLISLSDEIESDLKSANVDNMTINKVVVAHILMFCNFIKQDLMKAEAEYRIIFINADNSSVVNYGQPLRSANIRVKNNSLIPYLTVNIKSKSAIKRINIGPTNNIDISEKGVRYLLDKEGYKSRVEKSNGRCQGSRAE